MSDILGAVYDFLKTYVCPDVDIVRGWQNRASLPNVSEYVVMTLQGHSRHGTNIHTENAFTPETGIDETVSMLMEYEVQIDFCGLDEMAVSQNASICAMLGRDRRAVEFFAGYGLSGLFADEPRSLPFQDDQQWVVRYTTTLHLTGWVRKTLHNPAFTSVMWTIENVDVHHPVTN